MPSMHDPRKKPLALRENMNTKASMNQHQKSTQTVQNND
jgi:hypothetical protein